MNVHTLLFPINDRRCPLSDGFLYLRRTSFIRIKSDKFAYYDVYSNFHLINCPKTAIARGKTCAYFTIKLNLYNFYYNSPTSDETKRPSVRICFHLQTFCI